MFVFEQHLSNHTVKTFCFLHEYILKCTFFLWWQANIFTLLYKCVCVYIYICMYACMYVYMYVYIYICVCMYVYMYVYMYICVCIYIYIYIYIHTYMTRAVKRIIVINGIQNNNKFMFTYYMCVLCVFVICIYKYTHIHVYIKEKYVRFISWPGLPGRRDIISQWDLPG